MRESGCAVMTTVAGDVGRGCRGRASVRVTISGASRGVGGTLWESRTKAALWI